MKHFLQNHLRFLVLSGTVLFLSACSPSDFGIGGCTTVYAQSVVLTVTDTNLQPIDEYSVSYRIDGGELQNVECKSTNNCLPVYETGGEFAITISKEGYESTSINVIAQKNYCHVDTQTVAVKLKPLV